MMAAVSITPLPRALATTTLPAAMASTSPATPRNESPRNSRGSQKLSSTRRRMTSTGLQSFHGLQEDAPVANRQVGSLHQREPEIASQIGMLEISFVIGARASAGRSADDPIERGSSALPVGRGRKAPGACTFERAKKLRQNIRHDESGSPAHNRLPRALACGPRAPTTGHPASAPNPRPANADRTAWVPPLPPEAAGKRG